MTTLSDPDAALTAAQFAAFGRWADVTLPGGEVRRGKVIDKLDGVQVEDPHAGTITTLPAVFVRRTDFPTPPPHGTLVALLNGGGVIVGMWRVVNARVDAGDLSGGSGEWLCEVTKA